MTCTANSPQGSLLTDPTPTASPERFDGRTRQDQCKFYRGVVRFGAEGPQHAA